MAEYDLRSTHVSCLYYIYSLGNATATDLCEHCEEDKATISRALEYLEANGFVMRDTDAKRYKSPVLLTEKGREAGEKIANKINGVLDKISVGLSEEERVAFYRSLSVISQSLDALSKEN